MIFFNLEIFINELDHFKRIFRLKNSVLFSFYSNGTCFSLTKLLPVVLSVGIFVFPRVFNWPRNKLKIFLHVILYIHICGYNQRQID